VLKTTIHRCLAWVMYMHPDLSNLKFIVMIFKLYMRLLGMQYNTQRVKTTIYDNINIFK